MAKFNQGILGGFNGKVGTVIGYSRYGKNIMRAIANHVSDRKSEAQISTRMRFKTLVGISAAFQEAVGVGLEKTARGLQRTTGNDFFSRNWEHVRLTDDGVVEVDFSKLTLSDGKLAAPSFQTPTYADDLTVTVAYSNASDVPGTSDSDEVYIFVYQADLNEGVLSVASTRQAGSATVAVPRSWSGMRAHVYGFAVGNSAANNGIPSATTYIGSGNLS